MPSASYNVGKINLGVKPRHGRNSGDKVEPFQHYTSYEIVVEWKTNLSCLLRALMLLIRQHKYTVDSEELKTEEFKVEWRKKTIEVLVDAEARRRRQIKAKMQEEGREKAKEDAEFEERKRKRDHEKDWENTRENRIDSWRDFQKGTKKTEAGKKKKKMKVLG